MVTDQVSIAAKNFKQLLEQSKAELTDPEKELLFRMYDFGPRGTSQSLPLLNFL